MFYVKGNFCSDTEITNRSCFLDDYIIKDIIHPKEVIIIASAGKIGKTTLLAEIGTLVGRGFSDFVGHEIKKTRVLYITAEAQRLAYRRFKTARIMLHVEDNREAVLFYKGSGFLWNEENVLALRDDLLDMGDEMPRLIILDPISSIFGGDMASAVDVARFKANLALITEIDERGIAVICAHHLTKTAREGDIAGIYGSQIFCSAFDACFTLFADGKNSCGDVRFSELFKKDGLPITPMVFRNMPVNLPTTAADEVSTEPFLIPYDKPLTACVPSLQLPSQREA